MNSYLITTSVGGSSRTFVWDSSAPLPLGHPFQWIAERTESGVRVRHLTSKLGQAQPAKLQEVSHEMLAHGVEVKFPQISITLKNVYNSKPAYEVKTPSGGKLNVFACKGNWVLTSTLLLNRYTGRVQKSAAFILKRESQPADEYTLQSRMDGLQVIRLGDTPRILSNGENLRFSATALANTAFRLGTQTWRFASISVPALPAVSRAEKDLEAVWFKKSLRYSTLAFLAFIALCWLWPKSKPDTQELIPAQFTKIIMTQPKKMAAAPAASESVAKSSSTPKKVQDAAVVQAFRAKALQNAVSGLVKGGMTKLLAQSDFVAGTDQTKDAKRLFDTKSKALQATGQEVGLNPNKNVKVAAIGGDGSATGSKLGYSKGEHAGVNGQGHSFVSMDVAGAAVEEGLTKDEVGEVIHRHLSEVRYCYESAMLRTPDIEGKLMINFVIGAPGNVKSSDIKSSTLPDPRLDDCILRRLVTWKFPQTKGRIDVAVTYPFIFKTLGR